MRRRQFIAGLGAASSAVGVRGAFAAVNAYPRGPDVRGVQLLVWLRNTSRIISGILVAVQQTW